MPYSSVVVSWRKTLIPLASSTSTLTGVLTGRRSALRVRARMWIVCPGL
mgnify:CR=1 FL=1